MAVCLSGVMQLPPPSAAGNEYPCFCHRRSYSTGMRPSEMLVHVRRQPFEPFRVYVSDGASYDVMHPEMILITVRTVVIARASDTDVVPESRVYCDPVHITRIELLNGTRPKRRKPKRG